MSRGLPVRDFDVLIGLAAAIGISWALVSVGPAVAVLLLAPTVVVMPITSVTVTLGVSLLFLAPDSPIVVSIGGLGITPRLVILAGFGCQIMYGVAIGRLKVKLPFPRLWCVYGAIVLLGAVIDSRPQSLLLFGFLTFLPFVLASTLGRQSNLFRAAIRGILIAVIVLMLVALVEFLRHKAFVAPINHLTEYSRAGNLKANAGWAHPLALGLFFCLVGFLVIDAASRFGTAAMICVTLALSGAIFSTQERSPLLGFGVALVAIALFSIGPKARLRAAVILGCAALTILTLPGARAAAFRTFVSQSTTAGTAAQGNINYRATLLELGVRAVEQRPLVGYGYGVGTSVEKHEDLARTLRKGPTVYRDIANWPLSIAIETGLAGLIVVIALMSGSMTKMIRARRQLDPGVIAAAIGGLSGALVTSIGVSSVPAVLAVWFVVGLFVSAATVQSQAFTGRGARIAGR